MIKIDKSLKDLNSYFPSEFSEEQTAKAKTIFLKKLSVAMHEFYGGKIQVLPKSGIYGFNWFNLWYTPGVSGVSTTIRDEKDASYSLTSRKNLVAVVSDSTRVLGDGDVTPSGGMGVMEGKAFLMKYLGGVDGFPLCINNRDENGKPDAEKIIQFVKMLEPTFGAVNLEDISQPNCYEVLDRLREECDIPVWHDDAQGTACVTLAGLLNALKLADKKIDEVKTVFIGAGAANTTIASISIQAGMNPKNIIMFDIDGALSTDREDIKNDKGFYKQWDLCQKTNPSKINTIEESMKDADVLIALSAPGPDTVKPEWISSMNEKAIVFVCANPIPEIYPFKAKEAGAFIVATGRGDFPNQVNNSIGFPGILKGALAVRAKKITDNMAIAAAKSLANFAEKRGLTPENIVPNMEDLEVFSNEAADVAMQAIKDGVARIERSREDVYNEAKFDIENAQKATKMLMNEGLIPEPNQEIISKALEFAISEVKKG